MPVPCHDFHVSGLYQDRRKKQAVEISDDSLQHARQDPFVKGSNHHFGNQYVERKNNESGASV
jgi:hypothetical protein